MHNDSLDNPRAPFGSLPGGHFHVARQFDQQGQHDLAAAKYQKVAETAEPGHLRDFALLRYRQLTLS